MACLKKIGETQNLRRFNEVANIYFGKVPHKLNYPAFMKVFETLSCCTVSLDERKLNILTAFHFIKFDYLKTLHPSIRVICKSEIYALVPIML